jgi:hypothetical protein
MASTPSLRAERTAAVDQCSVTCIVRDIQAIQQSALIISKMHKMRLGDNTRSPLPATVDTVMSLTFSRRIR